MAYTSKTWTDFDAEYPTRYKITHSDLTEEQVRIANDFGQCTEGDVFDASTMNNLESRIASAFSDDADAIEDASGLNFAEEYDDTATYTVNDYCVHEGLLYKCISTISTAEAWTPAHWQRTYATDEIAGFTEVTGTLTAGSTSLVLSDSSITTSSTLDIYTTTFGVNPTDVVVASGSVTLTFDALGSDLGVKVRVY